MYTIKNCLYSPLACFKVDLCQLVSKKKIEIFETPVMDRQKDKHREETSPQSKGHGLQWGLLPAAQKTTPPGRILTRLL